MNHIEIIRDGTLEKIYFPLLPFCKNLTGSFRDDFNRAVDRGSNKSKVDGLVEIH